MLFADSAARLRQQWGGLRRVYVLYDTTFATKTLFWKLALACVSWQAPGETLAASVWTHVPRPVLWFSALYRMLPCPSDWFVRWNQSDQFLPRWVKWFGEKSCSPRTRRGVLVTWLNDCGGLRWLSSPDPGFRQIRQLLLFSDVGIGNEGLKMGWMQDLWPLYS